MNLLVSLKFIKKTLSRLRNLHPRGIKTGEDVRIQRPHRIEAAKHISIGDRTAIREGAMIVPILESAGVRYSPQITIGKDVYIGPNLYMVSLSRITIGDGCVLSESVFLNDNSHGLDPEVGLIMQQRLVHGGDIKIGNHCFLGLRSAIMPGVTLGEHCVVGINSVVTKSFPAYSMIAGVPARLVKLYSFEKKAWIKP